MNQNLKVVAFIPARSGSKRVPNKNIKYLNGHPLLAYTIRAAIDSGIFDSVICTTDSELYAEIARYYGAEVPFLRPVGISGEKSPDIEWVIWILEKLKEKGQHFDIFSILRPTSPFRLPETICRALSAFSADSGIDSLRAIEKCKQHPGKMWVISGKHMVPLLPFYKGNTPWHSNQYVSLPEVYFQDASLEISWTKNPLDQKTISGEVIIPFISNGLEGFDINEPEDWMLAEYYISAGEAILPKIELTPYII